jgi:hypothetical protein
VNLFVPEAEAEIRSPLLSWLTINAAFAPIPPDIDSGAGVLAAVPTLRPDWNVEVIIVLPDPFGVIVRSSFEIVEIVAAAPAPRLRVVALIPRVAALVIVARPEAVRVVSDAAIVRVLLPESRVKPLVVVWIVAAAPAPRVRVVADTPREAALVIVESEPAVIVARLAAFNVVVLSATVAAVFIVARDVAFNVVVPTRLAVTVLRFRTEPAPPFFGEILMLPVVALPIFNVWLLVVASVPSPERYVLLPVVLAEIEAVGTPELTLMKANLAELVALLPINRSTVEFAANNAPEA